MLQLDIRDNEPGTNRERVRKAFADVDADLLIVPETFTQGFGGNMAASAEDPEGDTLRFAREMAQEHDALFAGTWCVRDKEHVFNRLYLVRPDGTYDYYDKRHTFRISTEFEQVTQGQEIKTVEWRGWRIRPAICYDLRFPTWLRNKALDYDMLLVLANWPASRAAVWRTLLQARAIENQAYVAGCNRVGEHYSGDSLVAGPQGEVLVEATGGHEQLITITLDKEKLDAYRQKWPFYLDAD